MANTPHQATCGTCGGSGKTYRQTNQIRKEWVKDPDGGHWEEITIEVVTEETCTTCGGEGVR